MLHSAGLAIKALTSPSLLEHNDQSSQSHSIEQQKEDFTAAASRYFALLSSVEVRLHRQIYALEEADIIPAEAAIKDQQLTVPPGLAAHTNVPNPPITKQTAASKSASTGGGLGALDVGWLNSRNDNVGKEMEAELWGEAKDFMMSLEERKNSQDEDTDLFVDSDKIASWLSRSTVPA